MRSVGLSLSNSGSGFSATGILGMAAGETVAAGLVLS